jgi:hypothetical protein
MCINDIFHIDINLHDGVNFFNYYVKLKRFLQRLPIDLVPDGPRSFRRIIV